jgi:hypothetical protein
VNLKPNFYRENMATSTLTINSSRELYQTRRGDVIQRNITQSWEASFYRLVRTVSTIALPTIVLFTLANLPVASANKFTKCVEHCARDADGGLAKMICYTICAALDIFSK